ALPISRPLDAQHPGECLAVHGDAHEVVAARDGGRSAAEPTESPAAPGPPAPAGATKCLGDEPEAAQPTAAPPAGATLAGEGDADQLAQRAEEAHVGLLRTGLAAFLWLRRRAPARRPGRSWRGLARALHEPRGAERRSTATAAPTATTSTPSKP